MRYTTNHNLIMYLANKNIIPVKESGKTAYYFDTPQLRQQMENYKIQCCFYRGGKWE